MTTLRNKIMQRRRSSSRSKRVRFDPNLPINAGFRRNNNHQEQDGDPPINDDDAKNIEDENAGHEALIFIYGHNVNLYFDVFQVSEMATFEEIDNSFVRLMDQLKLAKNACLRQTKSDTQLAKLVSMPSSHLAAGISLLTFIDIKNDAIQRAYHILANPETRREYDGYLEEFLDELCEKSLRDAEKMKRKVDDNDEMVWFEPSEFKVVSPTSSQGSNDDVFNPFNLLDDDVVDFDAAMESPKTTRDQSIASKPVVTPDSPAFRKSLKKHSPRRINSQQIDSSMFICPLPQRSGMDSDDEDNTDDMDATVNGKALNNSVSNASDRRDGDMDLDEILDSTATKRENDRHQYNADDDEHGDGDGDAPYDESDDEEYDNIEHSFSDAAAIGDGRTAKKNHHHEDHDEDDELSDEEEDDEFGDLHESLSDTALMCGMAGLAAGEEAEEEVVQVDAIIETERRRNKRNRFKFWRRSSRGKPPLSRFEKKDDANDDESDIRLFECIAKDCHNYDADSLHYDDDDDESYVSFQRKLDHDGSDEEGQFDDETTVTTATTTYTVATDRTPHNCSCVHFIARACIDELNGTFQDTAITFRDAYYPSVMVVEEQDGVPVLHA